MKLYHVLLDCERATGALPASRYVVAESTFAARELATRGGMTLRGIWEVRVPVLWQTPGYDTRVEPGPLSTLERWAVNGQPRCTSVSPVTDRHQCDYPAGRT